LGYDTVNYVLVDVGYPVLYSRCFNRELARRVGLELVKLSECNGIKRKIYLCTHLLDDIVLLEAYKLRNGAGRLRIPDRRRSA
jgi:hypothetical protein